MITDAIILGVGILVGLLLHRIFFGRAKGVIEIGEDDGKTIYRLVVFSELEDISKKKRIIFNVRR